MVAGFRIHFTRGPTVCGRLTAVTELEPEPKAAAAVERWILALRPRGPVPGREGRSRPNRGDPEALPGRHSGGLMPGLDWRPDRPS